MPVFMYASLSMHTWMMFSLRSAAAETLPKLMSPVAPSPPELTMVMSSLPLTLMAALMPVAPSAMKLKWMAKKGTLTLLRAHMAQGPSPYTMVSGPRASRASFQNRGPPHPGQHWVPPWMSMSLYLLSNFSLIIYITSPRSWASTQSTTRLTLPVSAARSVSLHMYSICLMVTSVPERPTWKVRSSGLPGPLYTARAPPRETIPPPAEPKLLLRSTTARALYL